MAIGFAEKASPKEAYRNAGQIIASVRGSCKSRLPRCLHEYSEVLT